MGEPLIPNLPSDEDVAIAWIGSIPGFSTAIVAEQLPEDTNKDGTPAAWVIDPPFGFVTVAVVGGNPDAEMPIDLPVIQCDFWSTRPGSNKPPWPYAKRLARNVIRATRDPVTMRRRLDISVNGVAYPPAAVLGAYFQTTPRRVPGDIGDYARYSGDLQLHWITLGETYP